MQITDQIVSQGEKVSYFQTVAASCGESCRHAHTPCRVSEAVPVSGLLQAVSSSGRPAGRIGRISITLRDSGVKHALHEKAEYGRRPVPDEKHGWTSGIL